MFILYTTCTRKFLVYYKCMLLVSVLVFIISTGHKKYEKKLGITIKQKKNVFKSIHYEMHWMFTKKEKKIKIHYNFLCIRMQHNKSIDCKHLEGFLWHIIIQTIHTFQFKMVLHKWMRKYNEWPWQFRIAPLEKENM